MIICFALNARMRANRNGSVYCGRAFGDTQKTRRLVTSRSRADRISMVNDFRSLPSTVFFYLAVFLFPSAIVASRGKQCDYVARFASIKSDADGLAGCQPAQ